MKTNSSSQKETMSSHTAASPEWDVPRPGLPLTSSDSKTVSWPSIGMCCKTKPHGPSPSVACPCLATVSRRKPLIVTQHSHHTDWRNHESHWKHHLHYRRRIGYRPRSG